MKKTLKIFALVVFLVMLSISVVNATASEDLLSELSKSYNIGGKTFSISDTDKVKIERYLSDNPVTEEQKNTVVSKVDAIVAIMNAEGVSEPEKLSESKKTEVINIAKEAASSINLKLVVDTNKNSVYMYNAEGKLLEIVKLENGKLSYTGNNNSYMYVVTPVVAIIAIAAVIVIKKVNA